MVELPSGTVTFLFTDVEGSTNLWEREPEVMRAALARHDALLTAAVAEQGGVIVKARGEGDSFFAVFSRATDAASAAIRMQAALQSEPWPTSSPIRVRMALHTGEAELREGDYYGAAINRCARLRAAGHGGQVLLSQPTYDLIRDAPPAGSALTSLGEYRLKDLIRPEHVFQLTAPELPSAFPLLRTLDARPHNLPVQRSPLIGRERELAALQQQLLRDDVGLVTLTGPGGTGKTSLALQLAADVIDHFANGAFFVGLALISDPGLVASTIAQDLGIQTGNRPAMESLTDFLRDKHLLLILDNFEQILPAAPLVADLLAASSGLSVVVTSRATLRIRGEREFQVPALALPPPGQLTRPEALSQFAAVALFIDRATAIRPEFAVTNENAPALAEICARLDGLPLAIELAAARIRLFAPQAMLARLDRRLPLLTSGARDLPARQQTLRGTIAWSYDLLEDDSERALFRRLGVFVGGCTIEAAEAICAIDDADGPVSVMDGLESLVGQSLLRQEEGPGGEPRFLMLETIREFALEQLDAAGETERLRGRHAISFLDMAEQADAELLGPGQLDWLERLETEHDNFRAALIWSLSESGGAEITARLAVSLFWFWLLRSHLMEMRDWLTRALERSDGSDRSETQARLLTRLGGTAWQQGDYSPARAWLEESLPICRELGATRELAFVLYFLGNVALDTGEPITAEARYKESLAAFRESGDTLRPFIPLMSLGRISLLRGDLEAGSVFLEESLAILRKGQGPWGLALVLNGLGDIARRQGDYERARTLYEEGRAHFRSLGSKTFMAGLLHNLGYVSLEQQDVTGAANLFVESLTLFHEAGDKRGVAECLAGLAAVAAAGSQPERSARLFGASEAQLEIIGAPLSASNLADYERNLAIARRGLDDDAFAAAWSVGRAMPLEQAVADALEHGIVSAAAPDR